MISRETLYSQIFAAWQPMKTDGTFTTISRRLDNFANVPSALQPALFQLQAGEHIVPRRGLPSKMAPAALELFIYATSNDPSIAPSSVLNPLVDRVTGLLAPLPGMEYQSLNIQGVQHIWVEGEVKFSEGLLTNQSVAIIPVNILLL
jgi:hypothetical protein